MGVTLVTKVEKVHEFKALAMKLGNPAMERAAASGLNEHADEQRRQAVSRVSAFTGVPKGRMGGVTKVHRARAGQSMQATIETKDKAIGLEEYGSPYWVRDLNPLADGERGGSVSSMAGAEATAWNRRRVHKGTFFAKGVVWVRRHGSRDRLRKIYSTVLANELSTPGWKNVLGAEAFLALDLERRVVRHVLRVLT